MKRFCENQFQHHKEYLEFVGKGIAHDLDTAKSMCGESLFTQVLAHPEHQCFNKQQKTLRNTASTFPDLDINRMPTIMRIGWTANIELSLG